MQLTTHTDYALRTLIMIALRIPGRVTVREISETYDVSENHLLKVVQRLAQLGYVETQRGKAGGVRLAVQPADINLGQLVREFESELGVVGCLRKGGQPCRIEPACRLKVVMRDATECFLAHLDGWTLEGLLAGRAHSLERLFQLRSTAAAREGSRT